MYVIYIYVRIYIYIYISLYKCVYIHIESQALQARREVSELEKALGPSVGNEDLPNPRQNEVHLLGGSWDLVAPQDLCLVAPQELYPALFNSSCRPPYLAFYQLPETQIVLHAQV